MRWEKTQREDRHHQDRVEQRPEKAEERPLIADAQLLHDHVLHDGPEANQLLAVFAQARDPAARAARPGGGGKNSACGNFVVDANFHASEFPSMPRLPTDRVRGSIRANAVSQARQQSLRRGASYGQASTSRKINTAKIATNLVSPNFADSSCRINHCLIAG